MANDLFDCGGGASDDGDEDSSLGPASIPLDELPPLPKRDSRYGSEPLMGICIVVVLSAMLVGVTQGMASQAAAEEAADAAAIASAGGESTVESEGKRLRQTAVLLIWAEAATALACMLFLLLGGSGVIHRNEITCYPIPAEVDERLRVGRSLDGMKNLRGPVGSRTLGTYCVRCLVWRPPKEESKVHHCNICQRCVRGFDHHCGVFGRCIVRGNMPCFFTLIAMMFCGMVTAMVAVTASASAEGM